MADTEVKTEEAPVVKAEETTTAANGEAPAAPAATPAVASNSEYAEDESYKKLIELGLKQGVAEACVKLFQSGSMGIEDVDERAVEMLNSLPEDQGKYVINQLRLFQESLMFGVQNKAQYLMSTMRNFRDKVRSLGAATAMSTPLISGPDLDKMKAIMERTGYNLEITVGQRKYGGPPPGWEGPATGPVGTGHEVYIGHIPHDLFEDDLIPLFEQCGKIWDMRLMMDPVTLKNRGYAFLTYCEKESAAEAAKKFDGHEIASGKTLKVNVSVANTRLFLGNIPKSKTKEEILEELKKHADGCVDVILHTVPDATDRHKNRGFCFVDFVDHKAASDAKRKVQQHKIRPFNTDLVVDWAEQQDEPDEETMSKVKVLYVRNLKEAVTEDKLKEIFGSFGEVERIKKIKDYAFVHFKEREPCLKAMEEWNGKELEGVAIDCSLAKPQTDAKKKKHPQQGGGQGRGRGMNYGGGHGGAGGNYGGRGRANNFYPNQGYDDYSGYGGGYGDMGGYGGGYGGHFDPSFGAPNVYGGYGGAGDFGYGAFAASQARGGFRGGFQGGFGGPQQGGWGGPRGGGRGGPMRGGPMRGGPRGGGGFYNNGNRRGGKRPGQSGGGPASKRDNGADYSADVNMSTF